MSSCLFFIPEAYQPDPGLELWDTAFPFLHAQRYREDSSGWFHEAVLSSVSACQLWQLSVNNESDFVLFMEMVFCPFLWFKVLEGREWRISFEICTEFCQCHWIDHKLNSQLSIINSLKPRATSCSYLHSCSTKLTKIKLPDHSHSLTRQNEEVSHYRFLLERINKHDKTSTQAKKFLYLKASYFLPWGARTAKLPVWTCISYLVWILQTVTALKKHSAGQDESLNMAVMRS